MLRGRRDALQLHQEAVRADERVQRVERLHRRDAFGRDVRVRERRHAEVGEDVIEGHAAEAARRDQVTTGGRGASCRYASICASVRSRASSPAAWRRYQSAVSRTARSRSHRGSQPSSIRARVASSSSDGASRMRGRRRGERARARRPRRRQHPMRRAPPSGTGAIRPEVPASAPSPCPCRAVRPAGGIPRAGRARAATAGRHSGCGSRAAAPLSSARAMSGTSRSSAQSPPPMTLPGAGRRDCRPRTRAEERRR